MLSSRAEKFHGEERSLGCTRLFQLSLPRPPSFTGSEYPAGYAGFLRAFIWFIYTMDDVGLKVLRVI